MVSRSTTSSISSRSNRQVRIQRRSEATLAQATSPRHVRRSTRSNRNVEGDSVEHRSGQKATSRVRSGRDEAVERRAAGVDAIACESEADDSSARVMRSRAVEGDVCEDGAGVASRSLEMVRVDGDRVESHVESRASRRNEYVPTSDSNRRGGGVGGDVCGEEPVGPGHPAPTHPASTTTHHETYERIVA
jgi:hypothetical protein